MKSRIDKGENSEMKKTKWKGDRTVKSRRNLEWLKVSKQRDGERELDK